nr:MAG TPA: hypothetical protein [Caudoviricetes sp.]
MECLPNIKTGNSSCNGRKIEKHIKVIILIFIRIIKQATSCTVLIKLAVQLIS